MNLSRRTFFKVSAVGATTAAGLVASGGQASAAELESAPGVLVDTTKCIGCRTCETACAQANHLPDPDSSDNGSYEKPRELTPAQWTVVNRGTTNPRDVFFKSQCMHCLDPACASACPARALEKSAAGPVTYNGNRCLGCRYCMMACPFDVPKFEYTKTVPYVKKCIFCAERQAKGQVPACVEACPSGALTFGRRSELLEEARKRIYQNPDAYVHHVFGEHEAGGTSWLYVTDVPFERLGFKQGLSLQPYSALTETSLSAVPVVMTLWPPLLMGIYSFTKRRDEIASGEAQEDHHE
jgi:formate dehydrogenase iron-sulfur subunit